VAEKHTEKLNVILGGRRPLPALTWAVADSISISPETRA
jgi:hypothetical protein